MTLNGLDECSETMRLEPEVTSNGLEGLSLKDSVYGEYLPDLRYIGSGATINIAQYGCETSEVRQRPFRRAAAGWR